MLFYFQFETDFIQSMRCIPMAVRCKLDTCGIKLKLAEWSTFSKMERDLLMTLPCTTPDEVKRYKSYLQDLVLQHTQVLPEELATEDRPAWMNTEIIPPSLLQKAEALQVRISLDQWQQLHPLQRFALVKLSTPSHESKNFPHALREFGFLT